MNIDKRMVEFQQGFKPIEEAIRTNTTGDPEHMKKAILELDIANESIELAWKQRWVMHDALQKLNGGDDVDHLGYSVIYGQALIEAKVLVKRAYQAAGKASAFHKGAQESGFPIDEQVTKNNEVSSK